jgi:hypothetical protein
VAAVGDVEPVVCCGLADTAPVCDRDMGQSVDRVVDRGQHCGDGVGVGGEVARVAGEACVTAGGCPSRIAVGEPSDPQDQVIHFGGYRAEACALMGSSAQEVPFAGDCPPGGASEFQGVGAVVEVALDGGVKPEAGSALGEAADDDFAAVSGDG